MAVATMQVAQLDGGETSIDVTFDTGTRLAQSVSWRNGKSTPVFVRVSAPDETLLGETTLAPGSSGGANVPPARRWNVDLESPFVNLGGSAR